MKRAIVKWLASDKESRNSSFNLLLELGTRFPFDSIIQAPKFFPKEYCEAVWELIKKHFHQHPLIPNNNRQFLTSIEIREAVIQKIYNFCKEKSLISLWHYLWTKWYSNNRCSLWARSSCNNKLSILKTTMFMEDY